MSECNITTKLIMALSHSDLSYIENDLMERKEHPYKVPAPELGIDFHKVDSEVFMSKNWRFTRSSIIFILFLTSIIFYLQDIENNLFIFSIYIPIAVVVEYIYLLKSKERISKILQSDDDVCEINTDSITSTVISGGYSPFLGAGYDLDSWSFTINLRKAENKNEPIKSIDITEIYNTIEENLINLKIENIVFKNQLFINGVDVGQSDTLLFKDDEYILSHINKNNKKERFYKAIHIPMWEGQIVVTMYYRLLETNGNLFVEARFFFLPPLGEKFLAIKNRPVIERFRDNLMTSLGLGVSSWIAVFYRLFKHLGSSSDSKKNKDWDEELRLNRMYNYGWENSLREKWSEINYERYFQKVDIDFTLKILTTEHLSTLLNYISEKNISTDQFKETTSTIINEGVIVSGGEIKAENMSVGKGSNIAKNIVKSVSGGDK